MCYWVIYTVACHAQLRDELVQFIASVVLFLSYTVKTGVFSYTLSGVYWNTFVHWGVVLHS